MKMFLLGTLLLVLLAAPLQAGGRCFAGSCHGFGYRGGFYATPLVAPVIYPVQTLVAQPVVQQQVVQQEVVQQQVVAPVLAQTVITQPVCSYPFLGFNAGYGYGGFRYGYGFNHVVTPVRVHGPQRVIIRR